MFRFLRIENENSVKEFHVKFSVFHYELMVARWNDRSGVVRGEGVENCLGFGMSVVGSHSW